MTVDFPNGPFEIIRYVVGRKLLLTDWPLVCVLDEASRVLAFWLVEARLSMKADLDLVREVKAGNRSAFSELVRRHQRAVYRLAFRFTGDHGSAEDIVQDSFVKAYQKLNSFEERSSFKSWLFRIAINTSKNKLRSHSHTEVDIEDVSISFDARVAENFELKEVQGSLNEEVQKLPERQRIALSLRVFEDLSFQEIAHIMNCPYDTAKANYRHAVLKLKKTLNRKENQTEESESEKFGEADSPIGD